MTPFEYWKKIYLLFGDNFSMKDWRKYVEENRTEYNSVPNLVTSWETEGQYIQGSYVKRNGDIMKFTDNFWKELDETV